MSDEPDAAAAEADHVDLLVHEGANKGIDAGVGCIVLAALSVLAALLGPGWRRSHAGICTSARSIAA